MGVMGMKFLLGHAVRQFVSTGGTTLNNKDESNGEWPSWPRGESHSPFRS
jgi:hypothetical protein